MIDLKRYGSIWDRNERINQNDNLDTIESIINDRGLEILSESALLNWLDENGIKHLGEWDNTQKYEALSIVLHEGTSYTSKGYVPEGIDILNDEYWVVTGNYNAQVENYRQEVVNLSNDIIENNGLLEGKVSKNQLGVNPMDFGVKYDGSDETAALQSAIDYCFEENLPLFGNGKVIVTSGVTIPTHAIKHDKIIDMTISGHLNLKAATLYQPHVINIEGRIVSDVLTVNCDYKALNGIVTSNIARSSFNHVESTRSLLWGWQWLPKNNNNHVTVNYEHYYLNGSQHDTIAEITQKNNITSALNGYSRISLVDALPGYAVENPNSIYFARIKEEVYRVVNIVSSTIIDINHLDLPIGELNDIRIYIGGGVDIGKHGDNGVGTHNRIDAQSVKGVGIHHSPLYGHTISNLTAQGCGVGFGCWDFTLKGVIIKPYFEVNNFDWVVFNYYDGTIIEPLMDIGNMVFMVSRFLYGKSRIGSTQIINDTSIKVKRDFNVSTNPGSIDLEMGRNNTVNLVNSELNINLMNTRINELLMAQSTTLNVTISPGTRSVINFTTENDIEDAPNSVTLYSDSTLEIFKGFNNNWKVNVFRTNYNVGINNIPSYVGQTTVHNTRPYIAIGTSSVDDWKEITTA